MNNEELQDIIDTISSTAFLKTVSFLERVDVIDNPATICSLYSGLSGLAFVEAETFKVLKKRKYLDRAKYYIVKSLEILNENKNINTGLFIGVGGLVWSQIKLINVSEINTGINKTMEYLINPRLDIKTKTEANDIIYGSSGKGLVFLKEYRRSKRKIYLSMANNEAEKIILSKNKKGLWTSEAESNSQTLLGFSHGASGITYFLYEMFLTTGENHYLEVIKEILFFLLKKSFKTNSYITWPDDIMKRVVTPYWCSGTAGIGLLFSRVQNTVHDYSNILNKAANSAVMAANSSNTYGLCHGLAGIGEFIIEINGKSNISMSKEIEKILSLIIMENFELKNKVKLRYNSNNQQIVTSFMTGYPGISHFILRYLDSSVAHFSLI